jgi:peptidoglycan/LPS O-acetylase OafA/YrhL
MSSIRTQPRHPLAEYDTTPPPPRRELTVILVAATLLLTLSMPLAWHHHEIPADSFIVVNGIDGANWLLVIGVIAIGLAVRFYSQPAGFYSKWLLTVTAFIATLGIFAEYIDNQTHAGQLHIEPYVGPGFYVGLVANTLLVAAALLSWRGAESL